MKRLRGNAVMRLEDAGDKVTPAYDGSMCLEKLKETPIDVIILDIKMPGMDGIQALREIKSRYPLIEVILLTGHGTTETAVQGMKLGAFDYLLKPADFEELKTILDRAKKERPNKMNGSGKRKPGNCCAKAATFNRSDL
jgi:DNA-binding NtrC family response regulator